MVSRSPEVWWRPGGRSPFALDPGKPALPQIAALAAALGLIFGGPLLGLVTIAHYPPLVMDKTIYTFGLGGVAALFLASFAAVPDKLMPRGLPLSRNLAARAGWGLCATALLLGVGGIVNGYATPLAVRDVPAVAKHETLQRDPGRRAHYVSIRAWPGSPAIVDVDAPAEVYAALDLPVTSIHATQAELAAMPDAARVRLTVGRGRLGLEWLKGIAGRGATQ